MHPFEFWDPSDRGGGPAVPCRLLRGFSLAGCRIVISQNSGVSKKISGFVPRSLPPNPSIPELGSPAIAPATCLVCIAPEEFRDGFGLGGGAEGPDLCRPRTTVVDVVDSWDRLTTHRQETNQRTAEAVTVILDQPSRLTCLVGDGRVSVRRHTAHGTRLAHGSKTAVGVGVFKITPFLAQAPLFVLCDSPRHTPSVLGQGTYGGLFYAFDRSPAAETPVRMPPRAAP